MRDKIAGNINLTLFIIFIISGHKSENHPLIAVFQKLS